MGVDASTLIQGLIVNPNGSISYTGFDFGLRNTLPLDAGAGAPLLSGMRCALVDDLFNPLWRFDLIYNADDTSGYPWECLGGVPWQNTASASRTVTSLVDADFPTDPITFDLPYKGDWDFTCEADCRVAAASQFINYGFRVGGSTSAVAGGPGTASADIRVLHFTRRRFDLTLATGLTVVERASVNVNSGHTVRTRKISVMPVRIG